MRGLIRLVFVASHLVHCSTMTSLDLQSDTGPLSVHCSSCPPDMLHPAGPFCHGITTTFSCIHDGRVFIIFSIFCLLFFGDIQCQPSRANNHKDERRCATRGAHPVGPVTPRPVGAKRHQSRQSQQRCCCQ